MMSFLLFQWTKALIFTNMSAAELGQKLLQWGAAEWNQDPVTVQRVRESKKNKGRKRVLWQRGVKAYWAGKGSGKGKEEDKEAVAYPGAPWRKSLCRGG